MLECCFQRIQRFLLLQYIQSFSWPYCWSCEIPGGQQVASIHTVFTRTWATPSDGRRTSVAFLHHKSGSLHLKRPASGCVLHYLATMQLVWQEGLTSIVLPVPVWYQHTWMYQHPWGVPSSAFSFATFLAARQEITVFYIRKQETSFRWSTPWPPFLHWLSGLHGIVWESCPGIIK